MKWQWERASKSYGNYGNANQWTVNAGLASLARESAQNSNDARDGSEASELVYTFIRLTGARRRAFESALGWDTQLRTHLSAMGDSAGGAVAAGQIKRGLEDIEASEALLLLQVSDYGCLGLTGPEFPDDDVDEADFGNFIRLCRLDLFSGKNKASGGSFGLGKAVYWRFSRVQTVLFNSVVSPENGADGMYQNRIFGVNQGVMHRVDGHRYIGRGFFGRAKNETPIGGDVASVWSDESTAQSLYVGREDTRPGTTALLIGFYDPDSPEMGKKSREEVIEFANELRAGIEESFWPLLARGRMKVRIRVVDNGEEVADLIADPEETYTELVSALHRFDRGDLDETLEGPGSVVSRDIPIQISQRRDGEDDHASFSHTAKLVVTISDDRPDGLENNVCLFRSPEMVVQTIQRPFPEGPTYHAFLVAGGALNPSGPERSEVRADDFLRFAEPPAHDRWIPGSGRSQASQANLTARYAAPWIPNLRRIQESVLDELTTLFGSEKTGDSKTPEAIMKNLRFLRGDSGSGGTGRPKNRKPLVSEISDWKVIDGRWHVDFTITAPNQSVDWRVDPQLEFVGLDGSGFAVAWESLDVISGGECLDANSVRISGRERGRRLTAVVRGTSVATLPIPATEASIDVRISRFDLVGAPSENNGASK